METSFIAFVIIAAYITFCAVMVTIRKAKEVEHATFEDVLRECMFFPGRFVKALCRNLRNS